MSDAFIQPIDPFQSLSKGIGLGQQLLQSDLLSQQAKAPVIEAQNESDNAIKINELYGVLRSGNATSEDYVTLSSLLPESQSKPVREAFALLTEDQQRSTLKDTGQIFAAFKSGRTDVAVGLMENLKTAYLNSGDEEGSKLLDTWVKIAQESPEGAQDAANFFAFTMSQIPGGTAIIDSAINLGQETRDKQVHQGTLLKMAGELELTGPQKANAMKVASQFNQETASLILQYAGTAQSGTLKPQDTFNFERKLSDDYQKSIKDFNDIEASFNAVSGVSELQTGAGDQALIVLFNKMLDPGSVVRESEAAATMNSTGVIDKLNAKLNQVVTGEKLGDQLRLDLIAATTRLMKSARKIEQKHRDRITPAIKNYGLNAENIFGVIEGQEVSAELQGLRDYIKGANDPSVIGDIDSLTLEELQARFPNGYAAFIEQSGTPGSGEIDFLEVDF